MADENLNLNKNGDKKDDKKDALPPTLKDFQKTRIKLQGAGPRTLLERMKSFRKKDLMFILSGLGVLVAAPLAEHLMMGSQPNSGFHQGWDFKNGLGGFGGGGSPYEPGINGLAPGQAAGGNGDIITPFNARDPASLILSPDAAAQPPVGSSNAPSSDNSGQDNGQAPWKNVLAQAGGNAANAAGQSAGLPTAPPALGDGIFADHGPANSTSASYTPPPISASNVPNKAAGNDSLSQVHGSGVSGASPYGLTNAGSAEGLKGAANQAGSYFNRPTSAAGNLEKAASVNTPTGGSGNAGSGAGGSQQDKSFGQDSNKDSKSAGESLAEKAAEENQQHAIDLYWKKLEEQQMAPIKLREDINKDIVETPIKAAMDAFSKWMAQRLMAGLKGPDKAYWCNISDPDALAIAKEHNLTPGETGSDFYSCTSDSADSDLCVSDNGVDLTFNDGGTSGGKNGDTTNTKTAGTCHVRPAGTSSVPSDVVGAGTGTVAKDIGGDDAAHAGQDATAIMTIVDSICQQATSDKNSGGHFHGTSPYKTQAPGIYSAASKVATDIYGLTDAEAPDCGVNAAVSDQDSTALGEIDVAKHALADAQKNLTILKQDDITATNQVYQVICGNDSACLLAKIISDSKGGVAQVKPDVSSWSHGGLQNALNAKSGVLGESLNGAKAELGKAKSQIVKAGDALNAANAKIKGSPASSDIAALNSAVAAVGKDESSPYAVFAKNTAGFQSKYADLANELNVVLGRQGSQYQNVARLAGGNTAASNIPTDPDVPVQNITMDATKLSDDVQASITTSLGSSVDLDGKATVIQGDVNAVSAPSAKPQDAQKLGADAATEQKAQGGVMNEETTFTTELDFSNASQPLTAAAAPLTSQQMQSRLMGGS